MRKLVISRSQLASFLNNDEDLIRRFEELFLNVGESIPNGLNDVELLISTNESSQQAGVAELVESMNRLSSALESLPTQNKEDPEEDINFPIFTQEDVEDDLKPANSNIIGVDDTFDNTDTRIITIENGIITEIA